MKRPGIHPAATPDDEKRSHLAALLARGRTNVGPDQRRLWTLLDLDAGAPAERHAAYELQGGLDFAILQQAIADTVARHDVLRSAFADVGGMPLRLVQLAPDFAFDVRDDAAGDVEAAWARFLADGRGAHRAGPPLRIRVTRRSPDSHLLFAAVHELVADGASIPLFVDEVLAAYAALRGGPSLRHTGAAFAEFAREERAWLAGPAREELRAWRERLADLVPLRFPVDRPRPRVKTHRCESVGLGLAADRVERLEALAAHLRSSLRGLLLTGFAALLARYTGQSRFAIGLPSGRRDEARWTRTIGPLASAIPLPVDLAGAHSFADAVRRVDRQLADLLRGARLPFAALVDELQPPRDLSRTPLYQASFELADLREAPAIRDLVARPLAAPAAPTGVDLTLAATRLPDELALRLDFNADLCDAETARRMLHQLAALLFSAEDNPRRAVARLEMLSADERRLLDAWNQTGAAYPADHCLHQLVAEQARRTPAAVAVRCADRWLSFAELERRSNQLAHHLLRLGLPIEGIVGVSLDRSVEAIVAILAALKAGGAYLPLDPELPAKRVRELLADSGAHLLVTDRELARRADTGPVERVLIDGDLARIARLPEEEPVNRATADNLAYLIYTSGSSGQPKAVMVAHRSAVNNITWRQSTWPLSPEDRVLHNHSFSFDPSVWATFWPLVTGAAMILTPPHTSYDAGALLDLIRRHRVTVYGGVPSLHGLLMESAAGAPLDSLRLVLSGGEALGPEVTSAVLAGTRAVVANLYGPTEATIDSTAWICPREGAAKAAPIGRPLSNTTAHVLDEHMAPVPAGVPGEIYLGGVGVARGYRGRPQLTAERFVPDPFSREPGRRLYRTGDRGLRLGDGSLLFLGRVDDQIKVRGFRIELGEIEAAMADHPGVREAAALAVDDGVDRRLVGFVSLKPGASPTGAELQAHLGERLPPYMVPWKVVVLPELPVNRSGKLDRAALALCGAEDRPTAQDQTAPRTRLEEEVAQTFAEVLGAEVGVHVDFFEAGGTSLMLARAASRLIARFEMEIPVHQFFRVPTVSGVAEIIELSRREGMDAVLSRHHAERLELDATLAPEIRPDGLPVADQADPAAVLLTGATGYLGAFLLEQLLRRTRATVYCLVRAADQRQAMQRIRAALTAYRIWRDGYSERIAPVLGDLARPRLGQSEADWDDLAGRIDAIYHSGALVNFVYPYSALRAANVRGTEEVLRLACTRRLKSVHYVSTIDVLLAMHTPRPFLEDDAPLRSAVQVPAGYTGSKWVAEKVAHIAQERGIPVAIYRPGLVLSHTETGATQTNDYLLVAFRGFVPMGILPSYPRIFDAVPVDYVAKAIVHVSTQRESSGKFFHLFNPAPVSLDRFYDWIRSYGYDFDVVDFEVARRRALEVDASHPLYPLVPLIRDAEARPQESLDPDFIDRLQPDLECRQTLALLAGSDVRCPPMTEELAHKCIRYLVDVGFLTPPEKLARSPRSARRARATSNTVSTR